MALLNTAGAVRIGSSAASKVYAGATQVWPPFSPASVPGLMAWFDASQLTAADLAPVASWPDRSSNARHAVQATGSLQPVCIRTGLAGLRVVRFDGVDDYLLAPSWAWPAAHSLVAVAKANDAVPLGDGICNAASPAPLRIAQLRQQDATTPQAVAFNMAAGGFTNNEVGATQTWRRWSYQRSLVDANLYIDGASAGATPTTGTPASGTVGLYLGAANITTKVGNIDLAELIAYDHALTTGERGQLDAYLRAKWAI